MPKYRVTGPDGNVYNVTAPEGASQADIIARVSAQAAPAKSGVKGTGTYGLKAPKSDLATSYVRGGTLGGLDEVMGVAGAVGDAVMSPFSSRVDFNPVKSYKAWKQRSLEQEAATQKAHPVLNTVMNVVGGAGAINPTALAGSIGKTSLGKQVVKGAKIGAGFGTGAGFLGGEDEGRFTGAIQGALGGTLLGGAAPVLAPLIGKVASYGKPLANAAGRAVNTVAGNVFNVAPKAAPQSGEVARKAIMAALQAKGISPAQAGAMVRDAQKRGVPLALGDVVPEFTGSLSRKPGKSQTLIHTMIEDRQLGAVDRVKGAISRDLGPINNALDSADNLTELARSRSKPLYEKAYAVDLPQSPEIDAILGTPAGRKALNRALTIAKNERIDPARLGFAVDNEGNAILNPSSGVQSLAESMKANPDRFTPVEAVDEYASLPTFKVASARNPQSGHLRKGPLDLVSWLRTKGGIRDFGGELNHLGVSNKSRNLPFANNENPLGRLVSDKGMNLDDAAGAAWEAGYFPNMAERPSVSEFLDALDNNYRGASRNFRVEDTPELEAFYATQKQNAAVGNAANEGRTLAYDSSSPAGFADLAKRAPMPDESAGPQRVPIYNTRALHYVKRGLDSVVEDMRNPMTGALNLSDDVTRTTNRVRSDLLRELDALNPDYKSARAVYAGPASARQALENGRKAIRLSSDEIERATRDLKGSEREQFAAGFRYELSQALDKKGGSADVVKMLVGNTRKRKVLATLFGGEKGLDNLIKTLADENAAFKTFYAAKGNSSTAARELEDQSNPLLEQGASVFRNVATGNKIGLVTDAIRNFQRFGAGKAAERSREDAAALLTESDPVALSKAMRNAMRQETLRRLVLQNQRKAGVGLAGGLAGGGVTAANRK